MSSAAPTRSRDLIELGAYTPGNNPRLDAAVRLQPEISSFLRQDTSQDAPLAESIAKAQAIATRL